MRPDLTLPAKFKKYGGLTGFGSKSDEITGKRRHRRLFTALRHGDFIFVTSLI